MLDFKKIKTFGQFIKGVGEQYKDRTALIWRPRFRALKFIYGDLYRLSTAVAHFLEEKGVHKGERIILWAVNSPWWVATFFGCQLKGVVVVPLAPQNTPEFVEKIAKFTEAKLILTSKDLEDLFEGLLEGRALSKEQGSALTQVSPDDIAELIFTSGTTGEPKGVELRHRNILSNIEAVSSLGLINEKDRFLSFLPLSHIFEQVAGLFIPLSFGIPITQAAHPSGLHIRINMEEDHPTKMTAVPEFLKLAMKRIEEKAKEEGQEKKLQTLYRLAHRLPMAARRVLARKILKRFGGRLSTIVAGGAALDPEVGKKFEAFGIYVLQGYGATETSPVISVNRFKGRKMESVGPAIPGVEVKITPDGEVLVKGPNVVEGYFKNLEKTAAAFSARGGSALGGKDRWYYTDDLGFIDKDGHLHILGRKKYLIVTPAGENVYPEDLEVELNTEPEVADSAVVGLKEKDRFEIHAVLLPKLGVKIDPEEVIRRVNQKLEPYQRIQGVSVWPEEDFPRTVTKKVKKEIVLKWLKERRSEDLFGRPSPVSGLTGLGLKAEVGPLEKIIAEITSIPITEITPEKRLVADLKMDSLARVTFVSVVEEELNVVLDESAITPTTTVREIQEKIARKEQKEERYPLFTWPLKTPVRILRDIFQHFLLAPLIFISSQLTVRGKEHLAGLKGPVLFFVNHIAGIDAGFFLRTLPDSFRKKTAIAGASDFLFEDPRMKKFSKLLMLFFNIYPFSRFGQIKSSLEYTGRLLDRGFSVLFFPEGTISPDGKLQPLKEGAGLIAKEMGVPVVPAAISGTDILVPHEQWIFRFWKRPKVTVTFGKPLKFSRKNSVAEATKIIEEAMKKLSAVV